MPLTFEWAAHMHGLYSREAFLELAALTGLESPHRSASSREAARGSEEAHKTRDELHRQRGYAPKDHRARLSDVVTRLWRRQRL